MSGCTRESSQPEDEFYGLFMQEGLVSRLLEDFTSRLCIHVVQEQHSLEEHLKRRISMLLRERGKSGTPVESSWPSSQAGNSSHTEQSELPFGGKSYRDTSQDVPSRVTAGLAKMRMAHDFHTGTRTRYQDVASLWLMRLRLTRNALPHTSFLGDWPSYLLESTTFEAVISALILLNAILIGVSADSAVKCALMDTSCSSEVDVLQQLGVGLTVFFALEVSLRILVLGLEFWFGSGWKLNLLDVVVVMVSLVEYAVETSSAVDLLYIRLLRLSRLFRIARVTKKLATFHTLRTLLNAIKDSVIPLFWALVFILFIIFMFSVAFTQGVAEYAASGLATEGHMILVRTFFHSLPMTVLTLFMSITGGVDWWDIEDLFLDVSPLFGLLFVVYIAMMILALLNVVTGIFVNDALEQSLLDRDLMAKLEMERRQADIARLQQIFTNMDSENTGRITLEQFLVYWDLQEVRALFAVMGLEIFNAITFFESLDLDGSQDVSLEEFVMGCMSLRGDAKRLDMATIIRESKENMETLTRYSKRLEAHLAKVEHRLPPPGFRHQLRLQANLSGGLPEDHLAEVVNDGCLLRRREHL